jgi:hypothetical protein
MSTYCYKAYGLIWHVPLACPELLPCNDERPDVKVRFGPVPEVRLVPAGDGRLGYVSPNLSVFRIPGVASLLIRKGGQIVIQPEPGASEGELRLCFLGTGVACILHHYGLLPLHAAAVRTQHGAVLFAGHSGFGKSTLLAAFLDKGYAMFADDITAVRLHERRAPEVIPGYPQLKLWADSAAKLSRSTVGLKRINAKYEKYAVPAVDRLVAAPVELRSVYALQPHDQPALTLEPLQAEEKIQIFMEHTRLRLSLMPMGRHLDHFHMVTTLANQVPVYRVGRPLRPFMLEDLVDLLEQDFC